MTKHGSFKKAVRRHARDTNQRYTEALSDLEGVGSRMFHQPVAEHLLAHLRDHHGVDAVAAIPVSRHNDHVFRIDRGDGDPWIARVFPPSRPKANVEGDAAILRFLEWQDYPAERLATDDAVSTFDGSSVLVTRFVPGHLLPSPAAGAEGTEKFTMMGDLLGRLHALPLDESVSRPGGASGEDPTHEGAPRQDLLAALAFLDAVDTKVAPEARERYDQLRTQVQSADDAQGLPESLVHGNLLHAPDHVVVSDRGPVAIQWKGSGRGPRLADFAYLMWGAWLNPEWITAATTAYRRHIELTDEELNRLEAVMHIRPLYLAAFDWRRSLSTGHQPTSDDPWYHQPDPNYIAKAAAATRSAFR
ncbi:MAG TPA: aminoglycoside phosphotransferase family protein [Solirubrobacterales bacterium]|nr:aminoglycoside phosphotransferase family protein [Solirubrobacterales bacterium]